MLQRPDVRDQVRVRWALLVDRKRCFPGLLNVWDWCKGECRWLFLSITKRKSAGRFGLLNVLQARLTLMYALVNQEFDKFKDFAA